jgi:iron(III) transport system substrate-binding protein
VTTLLLLVGCIGGNPEEVVVYTALDADFSRPIFEEFTEETGIVVRPKFDTESTKTVGLVEAIIAERDRPRCDLFWNNEILHTLRLQKRGLLDVYQSPVAENYAAMYRDAGGAWHGFAARARVLLVNTDQLAEDQRPSSVRDLADRRWRGRCGIAKPLAGTTATHAACLYANWGAEAANAFFDQVKGNALVMGGNKQVAMAVASGQLAFGLTDTDDAIIEVEKGMPVAIVYPDQGAGEPGTLFIPNTLALIKGSPHSQQARRLVDYLLSPAAEEQLARGPSAQIPLNEKVEFEPRVETPRTIRAMQVDFSAAADAWPTAAEALRDKFAGG